MKKGTKVVLLNNLDLNRGSEEEEHILFKGASGVTTEDIEGDLFEVHFNNSGHYMVYASEVEERP